MNLRQEISAIPSTNADLRKFGWTLAAAFGILGAFLFWKQRPSAPFWVGISASFALAAFLFPGLLRPVQKIWMTLAVLMGWVMTRVLLSLLFFLAVTPIALIMRLLGKDPLRRKSGPPRDSYWTDAIERNKSDYENQF